MNFGKTMLTLFLAISVLPVCAYLVMKFGATGYFRAKEQHQQRTDDEIKKQRT